MGLAAAAILLLSPSLRAKYETGDALPKPRLVQPKKLALPPVELGADVRVVVFFYSASWCAPCRQIGAALRETYPDFRNRAPGLEVVTYSIDNSPRARADYLRDEVYPWPALAPAVVDRRPWLTEIEGGTPQFQAFAVETDELRAIGEAGSADEVITAALAYLQAAAGG